MMSEQDYIIALPFLADWDQGTRLKFMAGMGELQALALPDEHIANLIGVIILDEDGADVRVITKELCVKRARRMGMDQEHIDAILSPAHPGTLDLLLLAGPVHAVFGVPIHLVWVPTPGTENN